MVPDSKPTPVASLDLNKQLPIYATEENAAFKLKIDLRRFKVPTNLGGEDGHFQANNGLRLKLDGEATNITPNYDDNTKMLEFSGLAMGKAKKLSLLLNGQPLAEFLVEGQALKQTPESEYYGLTVDELRLLAISENKREGIPYDRSLLAGFRPEEHAPITDLHTHSSAQLSADDLIEMGLKRGIGYPKELLDKMNIKLDAEELSHVHTQEKAGLRFSPCESEGLYCEKEDAACEVIELKYLKQKHLNRVRDQLLIPQDQTICFSDFDREYYRYVNPFVKNPLLTKDIILKIAEDYKKNGVEYAELSTAAMLNLKDSKAKWFEEMIEAVNEAKEKTGVQLRFLIGIPRTYSQAQVLAELEKVKYAARNPLIAGVDLLGYELNKTTDFSTTLRNIAQWMRSPNEPDLKGDPRWNFLRDFTIRIHAGETAKNDNNVSEALKIAKNYGVHVRIAHVLNEAENKDTDKLLRELSNQNPPLVSLEFCPSSNFSYNNAHHFDRIPFKRWLTNCKSWFLGTDGGGAIQTNASHLAIASLASGVTLDQLAAMRTNERAFIDHQQANMLEKQKAYDALYRKGGKNADQGFIEEFSKHIKNIQTIAASSKPIPIQPELTEEEKQLQQKHAPAPLAYKEPELKLPSMFDNKVPLFVGGGIIKDTKRTLNHKTAYDQALEMARVTVAAMDPQKTYFVFGRCKEGDITAAYDQAIREHNDKHPENPFAVLSLVTQKTVELAHSTDWVVEQPGQIDSVPDNIMKFMRNPPGKLPGISLFLGGTNFTGDMIKKAYDGGLHFVVHESLPGSSQNMANMYGAKRRFNDIDSLMKRVNAIYEGDERLKTHGIFRDNVTPNDVGDLKKQAALEAKSSWQRVLS